MLRHNVTYPNITKFQYKLKQVERIDNIYCYHILKLVFIMK